MPFSKKNTLILFLFIFIVKVLYCAYILDFDFLKEYSMADFHDDAYGYLYGAKNLAEKGIYDFELNRFPEINYAYRMPGMAFGLSPFLYLFDFSTGVKLFILFQISLFSLATILLYRLVKKISGSQLFSLLVLIFATVGSYLNYYIAFILSETISYSLFIICIYLLFEMKESRQNWLAFLFSICLTWLIFLRPFMGIFIPFFMLYLLRIKGIKIIDILKSNRHVVIIGGFLLLSLGIWTYRNYRLTGKFIPLEVSYRYDLTADLGEMWAEVSEFEKDIFDKDKRHSKNDSFLKWFYPDNLLQKNKITRPDSSIFPKSIYSKELTYDSLLSVRKNIELMLSLPVGSPERLEAFKKSNNTLHKIDKNYTRDRGIINYIDARLRILLIYVFQPIQDGIKVKSPIIKKTITFLNSPFNVFFLFISFLCTFLTFFFKKDFLRLYVITIPALMLLYFFTFISRSSESREIFVYSSVFILAFAYIIKRVDDINSKKIKILFLGLMTFFVILGSLYGYKVN